MVGRGSESKYFIGQEMAVTHTTDGSFVELGYDTNRTTDEVREIVAEHYEVEPDAVTVDGERPRTSAGRMAVAFSKWRSKWDPHAEKINPNLN